MNEIPQISSDRLAPLFWGAFGDFLQEERDNILNGVSEQNLCGRLAIFLEGHRRDHGLTHYVVDTEYNRNGGKIKTIVDDNTQVISIRCDIILHSRGKNPWQDNLIAIEMKRANHPAAEKEKDRTRLKAMTKQSFDDVWSADGVTLPEHVCGYALGFYLELDAPLQRFIVEQYVDGHLSLGQELPF
jgi:hypothetical protein